ncbi:MAG: MFS transporter [Peptococcaceae bacterium BRH_c4a]|nr:MAG: MFS transporter [Peptococcaceae bacterium BRH_c4a]
MKKDALWTKDFILICLANFMVFTSFYFLLPTLPVFVTDVLKGDESNVGYIIGVLSLTAVMVRPLSGFLLDTVGRNNILLYSLIAFSLTMVAYNFVTGLALLFILRALHGISWGIVTTGAGTVAADVVPPPRRGEGLGYYSLSNTLAMAVGPNLGLYILSLSGFNPLFTASFAVAASGLFFVAGISYREDKNEGAVKISLDSFLEPKVFSLSGVVFFVAVVYGGIVSFITLYGKQLGVNAGTYFLVYALTLMLVRPVAGKAFDKNGPELIMAVGIGAASLSFVLLYAAAGNAIFLLSAVALGIGFGTIHPIIMAMAINKVAPYRRGAANGTIFSAFDLGIGFGSIFLGFVSKMIGLSYMYLSCSFIILMPLAMFYLKDAREYKEAFQKSE